jgi:hypothetical protein
MPRSASTSFATVLATLVGLALPACDSGKPAAAAADGSAADKKSQEDADYEKRMAERKADREAKAAAEEQAKKDIADKIEKITVIPEGTKIPKKAAEACDQVVEAQRGFMQKFHPQIDESALTTQLGMLKKQCNEMGNPQAAMCQKFALEATDEQLKGAINEYLPACMKKYPGA